MTHIEQLNHLLGEALGYRGNSPRFAWKYAPEVEYYYRPNVATSDFQRINWADRLGKVWMLCQYRAPTVLQPDGTVKNLNRQNWWAQFRGEFPYPEKGMYYAHPETALPPGKLPDVDETNIWIASLRQQIERDYAAHLRNINEGLEKYRLDNEKQFMDEADDCFPAFWKNGQGHEPGTRGAHVSFGGI